MLFFNKTEMTRIVKDIDVDRNMEVQRSLDHNQYHKSNSSSIMAFSQTPPDYVGTLLRP